MSKPLCIDLFCGLGGWAEGFLAEGYRVRGYDIEAHDYGSGGYPGELILADCLKLHGRDCADATVIVGSSPCTEYSYMAMPWLRSKQIAGGVRGKTEMGVTIPFPDGYTGSRTIEQLNALFNAQFRIQREACEAAGRYIPLIVENVRGAQPWVGRAKANFGSYYLWGDVGMVGKRVVAGMPRSGVSVQPMKATKVEGLVNIRDGYSHTRHLTNPELGVKGGGDWFGSGEDCSLQRRFSGTKQAGIAGPRNNGKGDRWFQDGAAKHGSKSKSRKAASAAIAKIPFPLAQYIARVFA